MAEVNEDTPVVDQQEETKLTRVEQAVANAMELVRAFSERDPHDGDAENPWKNPQGMLEQLDRAREAIVTAQQELKATSATPAAPPKFEESDVRAAYMDMITNAFGDVLEGMRTSGQEELDVDILVDCLQSGMDFMSSEDTELFMMELEDDAVLDESETSATTPHEQRRLQLGIPSVC